MVLKSQRFWSLRPKLLPDFQKQLAVIHVQYQIKHVSNEGLNIVFTF